MKRKLLSVLLMLCLAFSLLPTAALADGENVAKVGDAEYTTLQAAIEAAKNGDTITLLGDVDLAKTLIIKDKTITLDLNGKTISNSTDIWNENTYSWSLISVRDNGDLTINDTAGGGTLKAKENDCFALDVYAYDTKNVENTKLTINAGNYVGNISAVYAFTGKVTINGGHFSIQQKESGSDPYRLTLNCFDNSYKAGRAGFTVNGGTFENFDPRNNPAEGTGTSFVAEGVGVDKNTDGSFTAVPDMAAQIVDANGNSVKAYAGHYNAIAAAKDGEKVILLSDRKNFVTNEINANITIDLNGKTLSVGNNNPFFRTNGEVTIQNGTIESNYACAIVNAYNKLTLKNVKITGVTGDNGKNLVNVCSNAEVTIDKDTVLTASGSNGAAVFIGQDADAKYTLNVYGKVIQESKSFAISGNGSYKGTSTINIYDGAEVKSPTCVAIYHPQAGVTNIYGGLVEGKCAIGIKSGALNISGGTVRGTADDHVLDDSNSTNGTIIYDGSAIVVDSRATGYAGNVKINVTGGKVESYYSTAIREIGEQGKTDMTQLAELNVTGGNVFGDSSNSGNVTNDMLVRSSSVSHVSVSGGTFNHEVQPDYCADKFAPVDNNDGTYGVKVNDTLYVAKLLDAQGAFVDAYKTLAEAITAAQAGQTVTLLSDVTGDVTISKNITLDLGGKTLTNTNAGKATLTVASGATATVKNGSIVGGTSYYTILNNGTATLEDITATADNTGSSMLDNAGTLTINSGSYTGGMDTVKNEKTGTLTINGGTFENNYFEMWSITGVVYNLGDLKINNGSFTQKANPAATAYPRVIMTASDGTTPSTDIKGGTFTSTGKNWKTIILDHDGAGSAGSTKVSGGTFNMKVDEIYCAEDFIPKDNGDGTYGVKPGAYYAKIGDTKYESLQAAVDAVQNDQTITILKTGGTATVSRTVKFTVDPDGKAYSITLGSYCTDKDADVDIFDVVYSTPSSGSSGYYVSTPSKTENGTVTVSPRYADKGDTVTVTVKPDSGYVLETLTVTDKNGNELTLKDKGNGKYTFTMPSGKVEVKATFMEDNSMLNFFYDVPNNAYFYEAVKWAVKNGITTGVGDNLFAPEQPCTRAQIVTFLWRAAGSPEPKGAAAAMTDVVSGSYYEKAVAWAIKNGITTGTTASTFSPDATCTRAQAVTFLARALNAKAASAAEFSDVPTDSYFADAVAWAAANGVTEGIGGGLFGSDNDCTRGQIVTFLYRAYNK